MTATSDIVAKLWNLCHVLRDDGITYHQYVTELTYLLFLKMAEETGTEETERGVNIPAGYRWADLKGQEGNDLLIFYKLTLITLGQKGSARVRAIYENAQTTLSKPRNLKILVDSIDKLDWYDAKREGLGDLYEGLLAKNADEKKSGAGQYFTPRPLIDSMVHLVKPRPKEVIQDPAAGTGGFLIAAHRAICDQTNDLYDLHDAEAYWQRHNALTGMELVHDTHRLALMNLMLHGIESELTLGDTLSNKGRELGQANVILTNPPFGTKKGGGLPTRDDFTYLTSNKQLAFLQHIYRALEPGGRAAVVLPDNVLFEDGRGVEIRRDLMDKCDLHTILRLPTGIFYSQGVKTNVLFFTRGQTDKGNTGDVWVYDLRSNMPQFGKTRPLRREHFAAFEAAFGPDPLGKAPRTDEGEQGRFRRFTREQIATRSDNLDIAWLRDEGANEVLPEPDVIATEIIDTLRTALEEMEALAGMLGPDEDADGGVAEAAE
ncbi:type I restriction enzyme M protein [Azospirillum baldaniorum]|uniref:class I SAM-dependent DNA methyltransferase n=1 Tax=Azospirillum baldaniorum TaxID=1064539 RepID=UPI00119DB0DE|nr:N-6 DNA methylase [Azospirillum baldaniorum]TWA69757.1 type I restriction enzyme M protein [Azospirillum baldaniorum]